MSSTKEYLNYVLDQLSGLDGVTYRPMMNQFLLYFQGKLVGGIYEDRLLLKVVPAAASLMPDAEYVIPYEGAKREMLLVDDLDDREFLCHLLESMYDELPAPKPKKKKANK